MDLRNTVAVVVVALLLAIVVALVFTIVDAISEYAAVAGIVTFLVVLALGFFGGRRTV